MYTLNPTQAAKLGTLTHNTQFSPRDAREYGLTDFHKLVRHGFIERTGRGQYALTRIGEAAIRAALSLGE